MTRRGDSRLHLEPLARSAADSTAGDGVQPIFYLRAVSPDFAFRAWLHAHLMQ
jgi:hypothetical protein